jgi:quercetin dioxygenase-like cupin family protein
MNDATTPIAAQHVYDFATLDRVPEGATSLKVAAQRLLSGLSLETGKSSTVGAVLSGERIICTLGRQTRGTGAKAHSHANEQFNYILQGTMMSEIEEDLVFATRGTILHTPGGVVHTGLACPDEDLVFLAIKDSRTGIVGVPVDGKYDGPNCLPGFGSRLGEPRVSTGQLIADSKRRRPGPGKRYVYDMHSDADTWHGPASAAVTTDATLKLPPGVRAKLLSGERLYVAVLRLEPGATFSNYRRDNEQIVFVVEGELEAELENELLAITRRCILHLPPGAQHELRACGPTIAVVAQDKHNQ